MTSFSFSDFTQSFASLRDNIRKIRLRITEELKIPFDSKIDSRQLVFDHFVQTIDFVRVSLNTWNWIFLEYNNSNDEIKNKWEKEVFITYREDIIKQRENFFQDFSNILIYRLYNHIENLLYNISKIIHIEKIKGYNKLTVSVTSFLSLSTPDVRAAYRLLAIAKNSFHNNGIHNHKTEKVRFLGKKILFIRGDTVRYKSEYIIEIIKMISKNIEDIIFHEIIKKNGIITDRFLENSEKIYQERVKKFLCLINKKIPLRNVGF